MSEGRAQLELPGDGMREARAPAPGRYGLPTPEQSDAIAARDRDVFLEAGAGTGKTGVLVGRYCDAVTEDGAGTEEILAFTFTEKAAGELKSRIREELSRRAADAEAQGEADRALELARHARDTERAWITTIHGFCRRLEAAHPVAAGLDPRFRVLDEPESDRLAEAAFEAALEELSGGRDGETEAVAAGFRIPRLRTLIRTGHDKLRSQGIERPNLPEMPEPGAGEGEPELTPEEAAAARAGYECVRALLAAYGRHYEALKSARSGLDFEDLQLRAVGLLRDHRSIAERYRERFRHVMVDEFQDTNPLQLELIEALRGPETRLFTVGDEFQSIYGFRYADLEVFLRERARAAEAPEDEVTVLPLRGNFRSHPEVLAAVNALGHALFGDSFEPLAVGEEPEAEPRGGSPAVDLLLTEEEGWDAEGIELATPPEESSRSRVAEARFLASRLRELADAGVPRREMVVLLRAFTHVRTYEEALERAGLAPYVVGGRGYWSHQQVEDTLRLLGLVANPLDDETLFGALASPACGVRPDTLWLLRRIASDERGRSRHVWPYLEAVVRGEPPEEARRWADAIPGDDVARLRELHARLQSLRADAPLISLEALIDRAIRGSGYDLAALMRERGPRRLANVRKLMRLAREFEAHEGRDLRGFLRYAESRTGRDEREGQAATEAEEHEGVRVMTVHAAKGLEFGVIAVAELRRGLAGGRPDIRIGSLAGGAEADEDGVSALRVGLRLARPGRESLTLWDFEALKAEAAEAEAAEECRLAYVAATRARERLILSGTFRESDLERGDPRHSDSVIKRVLPALGVGAADGALVTVPAPRPRAGLNASFPDGRIATRINRASPDSARELVRAAPAVTPQDGVPLAGPPPLVEALERVPRPAPGHLSYSALADYERCGYRFYVERVLGMSQVSVGAEAPALETDEVAGESDLGSGEPRPGATERRYAFGNAVHAMLEWSARNRWRPPGRDRSLALLRAGGLAGSDEELGRAGELVQGWLGSELRAGLDGPMVRLHPEVPFMLALGGTVVRGKMDLVAELPAGELLVIDYKTDALGDAEPERHAERYAIQRRLYALAAWSGLSGGGNGAGPTRVRTAYVFLERPERPVEHAFAREEIEAARSWLEEVVAGVRSGRFEVTARPHRALCFDCPARARLCSHEPSRTMAPLGP